MGWVCACGRGGLRVFRLTPAGRPSLSFAAVAVAALVGTALFAGEPQVQIPEDYVYFKCSSMGSFVKCEARNTAAFTPKWTAFTKGEMTYIAYGKKFQFLHHPKKWTLIQLEVEDAVQTHLLKAWCIRINKKIYFTRWSDGDIDRPAKAELKAVKGEK